MIEHQVKTVKLVIEHGKRMNVELIHELIQEYGYGYGSQLNLILSANPIRPFDHASVQGYTLSLG